ncbi:MAG: carbohydrate-binding family 9-like protein [Phycisphaerales bacterium]|jgi:hypothetical protein|nr:carbohydrate-binding family 9-like protein [Phycisphaerales bacterium]
MQYIVRRSNKAPDLSPNADLSSWNAAEVLHVDQFRPESSSHHPITDARLLHHDKTLFVRFDVQDQFVRCVRDQYQDLVSSDTCVEFFLKPKQSAGYFNFEVNCGGTILLFYIEDPTRAPNAFFTKFTTIPWEQGQLIRIQSSLPKRIDPEITTPVKWQLTASVPLSILESYVGPLSPLSGQTWQGNFFKAAPETSHPHWASWSPITGPLRFHQPQLFGDIQFE